MNDPVQVFFKSDRATKRKSKYPRRERLILTDNGVGLALEVLFDGLGGLRISCGYKFIKLHFKTMLVGFKKKQKQEIKQQQ